MGFECSTAGNGGVGTQQRLSFSVCRTWKIEWKISQRYHGVKTLSSILTFFWRVMNLSALHVRNSRRRGRGTSAPVFGYESPPQPPVA